MLLPGAVDSKPSNTLFCFNIGVSDVSQKSSLLAGVSAKNKIGEGSVTMLYNANNFKINDLPNWTGNYITDN
jgi:hypothetical protein